MTKSAAEIGTAMHKAIDIALALPHVVEVQYGGKGGYEAIAAFNVNVAALAYARDCKEANPAHEYRVTP